MSGRQEVIAAIPNYNMAGSLSGLLPQILEQDYDQVYVLDDASTDDSLAVVKGFGSGVKVVAGTTNVGSGANRNRILDVLPLESTDSIIHFVDADVSLDTEKIPDVARLLFADSAIVAVGGLVKNLDGLQFAWNWGQRFTPRTLASLAITAKLDKLSHENPDKAASYYNRLQFLMKDRPNPFKKPVARDTFWVSEANMLILASALRQVDGFDPNLRVHDIFDLAVKLKSLDIKCRFDPSIVVTHKAVDIRPSGRRQSEWDAMKYLFKKHRLKLFF